MERAEPPEDELEQYLESTYSLEEQDVDALEQMRALLQSHLLTLQKLSERLKIGEKDILNVYISGSRLWGSATRTSDYDVILVVANAQKDHCTLHNSDIDASVLSEKEFRQRLADHSVYELICLDVPKEFCLKSQLKISSSILPAILLKSVREETDRDWQMAQKWAEKGQMDKAKKTIVHVYRLVLLATQLAKFGRVRNFSCALCYESIRNIPASSWADLHRITRRHFEKLFHNLQRACETKR